jgi:peptidase M42 family hydrolase
MKKLAIDTDYLKTTLLELLAIPSPSGLTDEVVHYTGKQLDAIDVPYELTRRGTIRATLARNMPERRQWSPACAIVAHLDTLGAMVREIKPNGRLSLMPVGTWSARWAEGGRVTLFTDQGRFRGTVLPLMASGHVYNDAIDTQPVNWAQLEVRVDEAIRTADDATALGIQIGDYVAFDTNTEILDNGYITSRFLDDKAGVAALLAALKAVRENGVQVPMNCYAVFTLTEEVGSGASGVSMPDVSEVIGVDIGPIAVGQGADDKGVTIPFMDSAGPHDYHLSRRLVALAGEHDIPVHRDVFRFYHSDAGAAVKAGQDVRTALLCFGTDASHGYERTHLSALVHLAELLALYIQCGPAIPKDRERIHTSVDTFSRQLDTEQLTRQETTLPDAGEIMERTGNSENGKEE